MAAGKGCSGASRVRYRYKGAAAFRTQRAGNGVVGVEAAGDEAAAVDEGDDGAGRIGDRTLGPVETRANRAARMLQRDVIARRAEPVGTREAHELLHGPAAPGNVTRALSRCRRGGHFQKARGARVQWHGRSARGVKILFSRLS